MNGSVGEWTGRTLPARVYRSGIPIDQDRVNIFADATDDHQWIHVDTARAAAGPFGTTIAHGYLTLALLPRLIAQLLTVTDQVRGTNYGVEKIRFTSPVPVGSDIRLAAEIVSSRVRDDGGVQYNVSVRIDVRGHERPAVVGESIYLAYSDNERVNVTRKWDGTDLSHRTRRSTGADR